MSVLLGVVLGDRALGGLDVDNDQPALSIALKAINAATDPDSGQPVGRGDENAVQGHLGADLGEFMAGRGAPGDERRQHGAVAFEFVGGIPG